MRSPRSPHRYSMGSAAGKGRLAARRWSVIIPGSLGACHVRPTRRRNPTQARDGSRPARDEGAWREDRGADLLRRQFRRAHGSRRRGRRAGRRFAGHGGAGQCQHLAGDAGPDGLSHLAGCARGAIDAADRRPAVHAIPRSRHRAGGFGAPDEGGRCRDGEAGRRRGLGLRGHRRVGRTRGAGVRAPRPDPAVGAQAGGLQDARQDRRCRGAPA